MIHHQILDHFKVFERFNEHLLSAEHVGKHLLFAGKLRKVVYVYGTCPTYSRPAKVPKA